MISEYMRELARVQQVIEEMQKLEKQLKEVIVNFMSSTIRLECNKCKTAIWLELRPESKQQKP